MNCVDNYSNIEIEILKITQKSLGRPYQKTQIFTFRSYTTDSTNPQQHQFSNLLPNSLTLNYISYVYT